MIERIFRNIPDGKLDEADTQSYLVSLGWARGTTWTDLLRSRRVLLISEAGAGKTYECHAQAKLLWDEGEPAFFVDLAALASEDLRSLLDGDEEARLDAWLSAQSEVATFFLDSIDELQLSRRSFERALKRLKKGIGSQLHRARIIITTRPIPFDEQMIRRLLPVPQAPSSEPSEETFARIAMGGHRNQRDDKSEDTAPDWRTAALMPLSDEQILAFARDQGVSDPERLLEDLQRRNAQEFARRPQDLIELCADWHDHKRIRTHRDQVASNIRIKLSPSDSRQESAELSLDKAIEGAARLALAMQVTRRLTIRHSAASDVAGGGAALDPAIILSDWQPNERKALLERPLFGFASYGRVRFHHRSVAEYLAAERLFALRKRGMPFRALKRLLFAQTKGKTIVRPSKRPVAGWLALKDAGVFELLRDHEPATLLNEGDPESLTQTQRDQALLAYADRYGQGGWRGLSVPHIQVHRFASKELGDVIERIWRGGVESPEVRAVLLNLIEMGRIDACADIAFNLALDAEASSTERVTAIDALVELEDERLGGIAHAIATHDRSWPDRAAYGAVLRLFPKYMSGEQLCQTLRWMKLKGRSQSGFNRQLARLIATSELAPPALEKLRDGLVALASEGLKWDQEHHRAVSDRTHLSESLAATCVRGLDKGQIDEWLHASVLALRLQHRDHSDGEPFQSLLVRFGDLGAEDTAKLFWAADALLQTIHGIKDPQRRFADITIHDGPVDLRSDRDLEWIRKALGDTKRDKGERAVLLEAAMRLPLNREVWNEHLKELKPLVAEELAFMERIEEWLTPPKHDAEHHRWEIERAERKEKEERRKKEARVSWIEFCREIATQPEVVFSSERGRNTAWDLWRVMRQDGDDSRSSGWNRRFIEEQFNKETADKLRRILMTIWRDDRPTLPSERPEDERRTELGLAAIYAEAEDSGWAKKLSDDEARLAARYAPMELVGFPQWMEALVDAHSTAVDQTLGKELSWELWQLPRKQNHSFLLHGIDSAQSKLARRFLPRLASWLDAGGDRVDDANNAVGMAERVRRDRKSVV